MTLGNEIHRYLDDALASLVRESVTENRLKPGSESLAQSGCELKRNLSFRISETIISAGFADRMFNPEDLIRALAGNR